MGRPADSSGLQQFRATSRVRGLTIRLLVALERRDSKVAVRLEIEDTLPSSGF